MYTYWATVIRWVDGDTVDLRVDLGFRHWQEDRFRLAGIDTPERGQINWSEATAKANELAPAGSWVKIETAKSPDKYGRWLATLVTYETEINVNEELVKTGLAKEY